MTITMLLVLVSPMKSSNPLGGNLILQAFHSVIETFIMAPKPSLLTLVPVSWPSPEAAIAISNNKWNTLDSTAEAKFAKLSAKPAIKCHLNYKIWFSPLTQQPTVFLPWVTLLRVLMIKAVTLWFLTFLTRRTCSFLVTLLSVTSTPSSTTKTTL